jgi:hypothetical protein
METFVDFIDMESAFCTNAVSTNPHPERVLASSCIAMDYFGFQASCHRIKAGHDPSHPHHFYSSFNFIIPCETHKDQEDNDYADDGGDFDYKNETVMKVIFFESYFTTLSASRLYSAE